MKKLFYSFVFIILLSSFHGVLIAQNLLRDDTEERFQQMANEDPSLIQKRNELERWTAGYIASHPMSPNRSSLVPDIIPVIVHVLHQGGPENISKEQVLDQIRIVNEDLRRLNADTVNTPLAFKAVAADCNIELRLAQLDPNGNCTDGIDRINTPLAINASNSSFINQWPPDRYLNIWLVISFANNVIGYTNYPGVAPQYDGIILLHNYFGTIGTAAGNTIWKGRPLTSLFALYLNVRHTWGDDNGFCWGDDYVGDTPNQADFTSGCPSGTVYDSCTSTGDGIMYMNFLDFSNGDCQNLFTAGQAARMNATLTSTVSNRNNLITPANLIATGTDGTPQVVCAPIADFSVSKHRICGGDSVLFSNASFNVDSIVSYNWSFPGGVPSTSNLPDLFVTYPVDGYYSATLTVTGIAGSDSVTMDSILIVAGANIVPNHFDDFETSGTFPGNGGFVDNPDNHATFKWTRVTNIVGATGSACLKMTNNQANLFGSIDSWITPSFNLTGLTNCQLKFKVAYAQNVTTNVDVLTVYSSTNCGASWSPKFTKSGANLATTPVHIVNFSPTSINNWRQEAAILGSANGKPNVSFKFEFLSGSDNNLFIDDFEVVSITVGIDELDKANLNFTVFPNPAEGNTTLSFNVVKESKIELSVTDVTGREVEMIPDIILQTGSYSYDINTSKWSSGIYFVKIKTGAITDVQKLVVQ